MNSNYCAQCQYLKDQIVIVDDDIHCSRTTITESNVEQDSDATNAVESREGASKVVEAPPTSCEHGLITQFLQIKVILLRRGH
jgi:hypothetical protein